MALRRRLGAASPDSSLGASQRAPDLAPCVRLHLLANAGGVEPGADRIGPGESQWCQPHRLIVDTCQLSLAKLGDPFLYAGQDFDGRTGIDWGLSGVPETYLVDGNGIVRFHFRGPITEKDVRDTILPFLKGGRP